MGSNHSMAFLARLMVFNLMFFTCVSSNNVPCPPKTTPSPANVPKKAQGKCPKDTLKLEFAEAGLGWSLKLTGLNLVRNAVPW